LVATLPRASAAERQYRYPDAGTSGAARCLSLVVLPPVSAVVVGLLLTMVAGAPVDASPTPAAPPDCVSRQQRQRRVDDGLSALEVDAIERDVRRRNDDPIIGITFERRRRSDLINHAVVQVKLLGRCDATSAGGRLLYFRRLKSGWRLDRRRDGRWASATEVWY
jgi:hypothetical protein